MNVNTIAKLKVSGRVGNLFADLYLPLNVWKELIEKLKGNRLTIVLRFEGEDGTTILGSPSEL